MDPAEVQSLVATVVDSSSFKAWIAARSTIDRNSTRSVLPPSLGLDLGSVGSVEESLRALLEARTAQFLSQFGSCLNGEQLDSFKPLERDADVAFQIASLRSRLRRIQTHRFESDSTSTKAARIKNRRMMFMEMEQRNESSDDNYFSDDAMKVPELFEFYIGRHIPPSERLKPFSANVSLVERIFRNIDDCSYNNQLKDKISANRSNIEPQIEEFDTDDEAEDDSAAPLPADSDQAPFTRVELFEHEEATPEERESLRAELKRVMKERFMSGLDKTFDYATVDSNPAFDDRRQLERDLEDDYFDAEEADEVVGRAVGEEPLEELEEWEKWGEESCIAR
ncbi:coiled-coil domain-containing protein-domain-containing protein [Zopfochytrium polystomum]|nr:coiled-coil domain-containing protein-domain-containing protein [Zopfochytrium polystomum]